MSAYTDAHHAALQAHGYPAAEALDPKMPGWARWHYKPGEWKPDHLADLERWGFIEVRREWKDNWVRPTTDGWKLLGGDWRSTEFDPRVPPPGEGTMGITMRGSDAG